MASDHHRDELKLVVRLIAGDRSAVQAFSVRAAGPVWSTIVALVGDNAEGETAYREALEALANARFARLARYDGRSSLAAFLALDVRDWLAERTVRGFVENPARAWRSFERQFGADISRLVRRRFPRADEAQKLDLEQEVRLKLIDDDYRRIRAYRGEHAFGGYILTVVDFLLVDLMRREAPRLRLPVRVARLSALHQAVFKAGAWRGVALEARSMLAAVLGRTQPDPTLDAVREVLEELSAEIVTARDARRSPDVSIDSPEGERGYGVAEPQTPEDDLLAKEAARHRAALIAALRRESQALPADDRAYVDLVFNSASALPAREMARLLSLPVEDVYKTRQRVKRWMERLAVDLGKTAGASV